MEFVNMQKMQKNKWRVIALIIILLMLIAPASASQAQSVGPIMTGIPYGYLVCLKPNLPFVWLHNTASSYSGVSLTLYPASYTRLVSASYEAFDGTQWWLNVYAFPNNSLIRAGYIEETSFASNSADGCQPPPNGANVPPHPQMIGPLCIKPNIPFIWERRAPSSYAPFSQLVFNDGSCSSGGFANRTATNNFYWDGVQWWIQVAHPPREFSSRAWVETNSLQSRGSSVTG